MENQLDKAGQKEIPSETTSADLKPNSEVFVIPGHLFNNILVGAAFFVLAVLSTMMFTTQSATAHRAEHEQLVTQSVAAALEALNTTAGNNQGGSALNANTRLQVSVDDPSEGASDVPITIVEFSDFNCQYCGRFARDTLPLLRQNYGDRIRFVYRDFAILGPTSEDAAVASECANEQSAFWAYHDLLFANQGNFSQESLITYAAQAELNTEQFTSSDTLARYRS